MAPANVTLCNLFLYEVQEIPLSELRQKSDDVIEAITSYLDEDTRGSPKLHLYKMDSSNKLKSIQSYQDIISSSRSNIIAVDLFQLGQSCLNLNSFNSSVQSVAQRHKALKLFKQFVDKIKNSEKYRADLAKDCLHSKYIEENLTSKTIHDTVMDVPLSNLRLTDSGVPDTSTVVLDNLISACKSLNQQACKFMHEEIKLYSWAEILKKDGVIKRIVEDENMPYEISIPSDVFELIKRDLYNDGGLHVNGELESLGKGGFGEAFKYTTTQLQMEMTLVIKQSMLQEGAVFNSKPGWYREAYHTEQLSHANIIKYYGKPILYREKCYAVMEFGGTSLHDKYIKVEQSMMAPEDIRQALLHISSAIVYLHELFVIHRDIRTTNVTVSDNGVYKLIDFGLSSETTEMNSRFTSHTNWGHHLWKSPEYCKHIIDREHNAAPGRSSDIWMFGVFVLEMLSFPHTPSFFKGYSKNDQAFNFRNHLAISKVVNLHDSIPDNCDLGIRNIVLKCLEFDEDKRIKCKELSELCTLLIQPDVEGQSSSL